MKSLHAYRRTENRWLALAPLILCVAAFALPAAWDLSQTRNPSEPRLSAMHFGAMPSAGACFAPAQGDPKTEECNTKCKSTPISNPSTKPSLPSFPAIRFNFSELFR